MRLSAEALAKLGELDLQGAKADLDFVPTAESRRPVLADLSPDGMRGFRDWDFSEVSADLNNLTFEAGQSKNGKRRRPLIDKLQDKVSHLFGKKPPGEKRRAFQYSEYGEWDGLSEEDKNAALGEWFKIWKDSGKKPTDWQKDLLIRYGFWGGGEEPADEPDEEEVEEELVGAAAGSLAGAGGKARRFFESEKVLAGAEFAVGGLVGVTIAEISKLDPTWEAGIVVMAQFALGLSRLGTELGAQAIEVAEARFPRFARLSARLAGEKGLAGVFRSIKNLATRIQNRPFLAGLSAGIIGHSAFEAITGHSMFPDVNAAEPPVTVEPAATEAPAATVEPGGGEWPDESRFVGSQSPAAGDIGRVGINPADQPSPAEDWTVAGGGEQVGGGISPVDQPSPAGDWTGVAGGATEGNGQPPEAARQAAAEAAAGAEPTAGVEPTVAAEPGATEASSAVAGGGDAGEQGAEPGGGAEAAAEAAEAALESGKTIGELAESSGQVPWNVVRGMAGDGAHAGEVTNVVTRALQAGGVDISSLPEGAISQLVTKVQGFFDSADNALQTFNIDHPYAPRPYDAGGLEAVRAVKGLNSPEALAIRAGNLGDMEAAGNLFNNVLKQVLSP